MYIEFIDLSIEPEQPSELLGKMQGRASLLQLVATVSRVDLDLSLFFGGSCCKVQTRLTRPGSRAGVKHFGV